MDGCFLWINFERSFTWLGNKPLVVTSLDVVRFENVLVSCVISSMTVTSRPDWEFNWFWRPNGEELFIELEVGVELNEGTARPPLYGFWGMLDMGNGVNLLDLLWVYDGFWLDPTDMGNGICWRLCGQLEPTTLLEELFGQVEDGEGLALQLETPKAFATALFDASNVDTAGNGLRLVPELYAGIVFGLLLPLLIAEDDEKWEFGEGVVNINGLLLTPIWSSCWRKSSLCDPQNALFTPEDSCCSICGSLDGEKLEEKPSSESLESFKFEPSPDELEVLKTSSEGEFLPSGVFLSLKSRVTFACNSLLVEVFSRASSFIKNSGEL